MLKTDSNHQDWSFLPKEENPFQNICITGYGKRKNIEVNMSSCPFHKRQSTSSIHMCSGTTAHILLWAEKQAGKLNKQFWLKPQIESHVFQPKDLALLTPQSHGRHILWFLHNKLLFHVLFLFRIIWRLVYSENTDSKLCKRVGVLELQAARSHWQDYSISHFWCQ